MAVSCRPCRCDSVYCAVVTVLVVVAAISKNRVHAFDVTTTASSTVSTTIAANTGLYSTTPPRQPRRNLQKRPRKNRKVSDSTSQLPFFTEYTGTNDGTLMTTTTTTSTLTNHRSNPRSEDVFWETAERRTIVSAAAREAGEDYWMDAEALQRLNEQQQQQQQRRRRDPNQMSDQKLWIEVLSPYKQNWIGLISVSMIVFAFIFKYFPEVIDPPIISDIPEIL